MTLMQVDVTVDQGALSVTPAKSPQPETVDIPLDMLHALYRAQAAILMAERTILEHIIRQNPNHPDLMNWQGVMR